MGKVSKVGIITGQYGKKLKWLKKVIQRPIISNFTKFLSTDYSVHGKVHSRTHYSVNFRIGQYDYKSKLVNILC